MYLRHLIFSGAALPYEAMPEGLQRFADFLPLTQNIKLFKAASLGADTWNVVISVVILLAVAAVCTCVSSNILSGNK